MRAFYLLVLKDLVWEGKTLLKKCIAGIPFLCRCLHAAMEYFRLLQRKKCRKDENTLFSSHVQVPVAYLQ